MKAATDKAREAFKEEERQKNPASGEMKVAIDTIINNIKLYVTDKNFQNELVIRMEQIKADVTEYNIHDLQNFIQESELSVTDRNRNCVIAAIIAFCNTIVDLFSKSNDLAFKEILRHEMNKAKHGIQSADSSFASQHVYNKIFSSFETEHDISH